MSLDLPDPIESASFFAGVVWFLHLLRTTGRPVPTPERIAIARCLIPPGATHV